MVCRRWPGISAADPDKAIAAHAIEPLADRRPMELRWPVLARGQSAAWGHRQAGGSEAHGQPSTQQWREGLGVWHAWESWATRVCHNQLI